MLTVDIVQTKLFILHSSKISKASTKAKSREICSHALNRNNCNRQADSQTTIVGSGGDLAPSLGGRNFFFADQDF